MVKGGRWMTGIEKKMEDGVYDDDDDDDDDDDISNDA